MGYNVFQAIPIRTSYQKKLEKFTSSLGNAICKGETIPFADNDLTYTLKLQNERIKEKGLEMEYEVYQRSNSDHRFFDTSDWKDEHYASSVGFGVLGVNREVKKDGKRLFRDRLKSVFYGTVTDIVSGGHPDNEIHICPNCGAESTIAGLQNGCSYCGTQYKMDDLFPKITGYYFLDDVGLDSSQLLKGWLISSIICTLFLYVVAFFAGIASIIAELLNNINPLLVLATIPQSFIAGLIVGPISGAISGYIVYMMFVMVRMIIQGLANSGKMGTAGSRSRFEVRMKKLSPEFSFEYFTSKAISLIKTAIYAKDESELLFYKGDKLSAEMKNIIDLNYGGALGLIDFKEENGIVTVDTVAYFDVLYASGEKVQYKHQVFGATFQRRTDIPVNLNFSMTRISCPTCGTSFNAMKNKFCPSCGNEYELISDDWVLTEIKLK